EDDIRLLPADALDLDLRLGTWAQHLDVGRRVLETSGGPIGFDHLVIATGSVPVLPSGWRELAGVTALRTLDDARPIRAAARAGPGRGRARDPPGHRMAGIVRYPGRRRERLGSARRALDERPRARPACRGEPPRPGRVPARGRSAVRVERPVRPPDPGGRLGG